MNMIKNVIDKLTKKSPAFGVECAIRNNFGGFDPDWQGVYVRVKDNSDGTFAVRLEGTARNLGMKRQAEAAASGVDGVTSVVNNISISDGG